MMSTTKRPFVSIIVPIYNTAEFLEGCIESVLQQEFKDWELILVDDGSTDDSPKIIDKYVKAYSQIKSVNSNSGCVSIARNMGIEIAEGKYVYFIDSDDYIFPYGIKILADEAIKQPEAVFIQGSFSVLNMKTSGLVKSARFEKLKEINGEKISGYRYLKYCGTTILFPFNSLISRKFLLESGILFPTNITHQEDAIFILSILLTNKDCMYVDNNGYVYRWGRLGSLTTGTPQDKESNIIKRKKLISAMIKSTMVLQEIKSSDKQVDKIINNLIIDNVTGCIGGASLLLPDMEVFNELQTNIKHVKVLNYDLRGLLALIYNISPKTALRIRNLLN